MKTWPWLLAAACALLVIWSGCRLPATFEVSAVRILSGDQAGTIMGSDWVQRAGAGATQRPRMVLVELTSRFDLAKYAGEKHRPVVAVDVFINDDSRRQLNIVVPWIYSGGKNVSHLGIGDESAAMENGLYCYQILLISAAQEDEVGALLEEGTPLCLQMRAGDMINVYRSKDIILTKAMLSPDAQGS